MRIIQLRVQIKRRILRNNLLKMINEYVKIDIVIAVICVGDRTKTPSQRVKSVKGEYLDSESESRRSRIRVFEVKRIEVVPVGGVRRGEVKGGVVVREEEESREREEKEREELFPRSHIELKVREFDTEGSQSETIISV